jgi:hypothetical protein
MNTEQMKRLVQLVILDNQAILMNQVILENLVNLMILVNLEILVNLVIFIGPRYTWSDLCVWLSETSE